MELTPNDRITPSGVLYKCRMLPDLWPKVNEIQPDLKIEIRPMKEYENRTTAFSRLGLDFDLFEGIYASAWKGFCQFLELKRTPLCCAVSRNHRLAKASELSMQDLSGEVLVMPVKGVSEEMDSFREKVLSDYPSAKVIDSNYYGVDTFAMCEMNSYNGRAVQNIEYTLAYYPQQDAEFMQSKYLCHILRRTVRMHFLLHRAVSQVRCHSRNSKPLQECQMQSL